MANTQILRCDQAQTSEELAGLMRSAFTGTNPRVLVEDEVAEYWKIAKKKLRTEPRTLWLPKKRLIVSFLLSTAKAGTPSGGVETTPIQTPDQGDIYFAKCLTRVFNDDVRTAEDMQIHSELWTSLRQTQFRRAIARFSNFSTIPLVRWMQIIESSTSLSYEGKPFSLCLFMAKRRTSIIDQVGTGFIPFARPIPLAKAILSEKWIRAAVDGSTIGLLGVGRSGKVIGLVAIPYHDPKADDEGFVPHESLHAARALLRPGTMAILTSAQGDIHILFPNGKAFHHTQGRWHYLNYESIFSLLSKRLNLHFAKVALSSALNLSYERQGALLCTLTDPHHIAALVKDHRKRGRPNEALRSSVSGLNLLSNNHRRIIMSAARTDGALVLDREGKVLDVACMIGDPPMDDVIKMGFSKHVRFPGARSTAAWNSSLYGLSIKISEDGPIEIYENGQRIGHLG